MDKARWISIENTEGVKGINPWETVITDEMRNEPLEKGDGLPLFRNVFMVSERPVRVTIKATSLGIFDLFVNGEKVGCDELKPGWTDYSKRVLYYEYDITNIITTGPNCISSVVSPGWWQGRISVGTYGKHNTAFIATVELEFTDGSKKIINTDRDWKCSIGGSILFADIWDGEIYDARIDNDSYKKADFDDTTWENPVIFNDFAGEITKHIGPAIKERKSLNIHPTSMRVYEGVKDNSTDFGEVIRTPCSEDINGIVVKKGQTLVIDLGQNIVGRPKFTVKGRTGSTMIVRFAEMLNDSGDKSRGNDGPKGSIYTANYRSARSKLHYIFKGTLGYETYNPTHTFYGFRYLEITADDDITIKSTEGCVLGSDIPETGTIKTSSEDVNKLINNILWGQRGNYLSIPTDCPQRDERFGWTGDTQIFVTAASYNANVLGFFHKWMQDMRDSQSEEGAFPDVAPRVRVVGEGNAAWGDAGIIVPHVIYRMFADKDIILENFEAMNKYMDYLKGFGLGGGEATYGDWLSYEPTDQKYISCCCFAINTLCMIDMSKAIDSDMEKEYQKLYDEIRGYFTETYIENNKLKITSQTGYLLALKSGLLPKHLVCVIADCLEDKIKENDYKLSTGFIGTGILNQTLSKFGKGNIAYSLLLQTKDPSWLYSVHQGATTVWERWNSYTIETGFGNSKMNSFNHYAYGAVLEWMYRYMAGIDTEFGLPGFKHIILRPTPDTRTEEEIPSGQNKITFVDAKYESINGTITSSWTLTNGTFVYKAKIPATATLYFPLINKKDAISINGIKQDDYTVIDNMAIIELKPGKYTIQ